MKPSSGRMRFGKCVAGVARVDVWLANRYRLIAQPIKEIGIPATDVLCVDVASVFAQCTGWSEPLAKQTDDEVQMRMLKHIEFVVGLIKPQEHLFIAVDGENRTRARVLLVLAFYGFIWLQTLWLLILGCFTSSLSIPYIVAGLRSTGKSLCPTSQGVQLMSISSHHIVDNDCTRYSSSLGVLMLRIIHVKSCCVENVQQ